jgi:N-acetylneuraminic acid mutarotase
MNKLICMAAVSVCVGATVGASARDVTFDDRVAAQKAIEQVYWSHRVWPAENKTAKPPLSAVMPDTAIRAKVEDYLAKSNALERWWRRPVTAEQLQAELERMTKGTQDGALLNELFQALGNDAELIAETLARQTLAERLIHNWYGSDTRFHAETKARAEAAVASCKRASCMKAFSGDYSETTWIRSDDRGPRVRDAKGTTVAIGVDDWADQLKRFATRFDVTDAALPVGRLSALGETTDGFSVTAVLAQRDGEITTASVVWPKRSFDTWWDAERGAVGSAVVQPSGTFALQAAPSSACSNDTWKRTHFLAPDARTNFNAVWTGSEMIVWGGTGRRNDYVGALNNGGRYNPSTDTWVPIAHNDNAPPVGVYTSAVWTGTEMIVWGGFTGQYGKAGARYNPTTDTWTRISIGASCPSGRFYHSAVWTGSEMIIWGGQSFTTTFENTGGRYNPSTDTWTATSTAGAAPVGRYGQSAVWTGTEMIIWGGETAPGGPDSTGARYNPTTDTWTATSIGANVPSNRYYHSAFWTGTVMLIWGGEDDGVLFNTGGRYNPSTNTWIPTSTTGAPSGRYFNSSVWTGSEMIVWGGGDPAYVSTGSRYNPVTNTWVATSTGANVPTGRAYHQAVWTGSEMIVWGGWGPPFGELSTGARYSPSSNTWAPISPGAGGIPERAQHGAVWTGSEMIVWGGQVNSTPVTNSGGKYNPSLDNWTPTSMASGVPTPRMNPAAAWTGTEMLVWGGTTGNIDFRSGSRYNPASNTWTAIPTTNAPSARHDESSVWTGSELIVWGGQDQALTPFNDGGRYNPATNTWTPTSLGANVPDARYAHSAAWSGSEMLVWGGADINGVLATGGRYTPTTDSWAATSTGANLPAARRSHTGVWTGTAMTVWGGFDGSELNTGARYNPGTDSWSPTSTSPDVPTARQSHTAVWTGEEMVVWGGSAGSTVFKTGGRYNPLSDSWTPTSTGANVPPARGAHSAIWTGTEMVVWGGTPHFEQGGLYCACPNGLGVYYRDLDGDGHGNAAAAQSACNQPGGYVASSDDCDDANVAVYSGAPELNDGVDNQCPGNPGYGIADEINDSLKVASGGVVSWTDTSGAATFDVARSANRNLSPCAIIGTATSGSPSVTDVTVPPPGGAYYYVVRAASAHVGSWGKSSSGAERSLACP